MDPSGSAAAATPSPARLAKAFPPLRELIIARLHAVRGRYTTVSILQLGMVDDVQVDGQHIVVVCRYPAAWYSNDTSLALATEIHDQLARIPGVWTSDVVLLSEGTAGRQSGARRLPSMQPIDTSELVVT